MPIGGGFLFLTARLLEEAVFCPFAALQRHNQRTRGNERRADQGLGRKFLMQKRKGQHQSDDHAELVHRHHLRRLSDLQRAIVAEPGRARGQSGENEKDPAPATDRSKACLRIRQKHSVRCLSLPLNTAIGLLLCYTC